MESPASGRPGSGAAPGHTGHGVPVAPPQELEVAGEVVGPRAELDRDAIVVADGADVLTRSAPARRAEPDRRLVGSPRVDLLLAEAPPRTARRAGNSPRPRSKVAFGRWDSVSGAPISPPRSARWRVPRHWSTAAPASPASSASSAWSTAGAGARTGRSARVAAGQVGPAPRPGTGRRPGKPPRAPPRPPARRRANRARARAAAGAARRAAGAAVARSPRNHRLDQEQEEREPQRQVEDIGVDRLHLLAQLLRHQAAQARVKFSTMPVPPVLPRTTEPPPAFRDPGQGRPRPPR
jgi:hypothetical protein